MWQRIARSWNELVKVLVSLLLHAAAPLALARIPPVLVESLSRAVARSPYQAPFLSAFGSASENGYARKPISIGPVETGTVLSWMTAALAVGASALFFRPFV